METTETKIIGKNIANFRETIGYTHQQIAEYLGASKSDIIAIENGSISPSLEQLEKLASLFSLDEYDFSQKNPKSELAGMKLAFKTKIIKGEDLSSIADFMKIIRNYVRMENELSSSS